MNHIVKQTIPNLSTVLRYVKIAFVYINNQNHMVRFDHQEVIIIIVMTIGRG